MSRIAVFKLFAVSLICMSLGCKSSTAPNSTTSSSGTLIFDQPIDEVADAVLGSNSSSVLFHGDEPSFAPGGRIIWATNWNFSTTGTERIVVSSLDGTNQQTIIDLKGSIESVPAHPKMSPDGRYVSFNYYEDLGATLGTHFGTMVYTSSGVAAYYIDSMWDASWGPDGSLVLSGTITAYSLSSWTPLAQGLFKVDKDFKTIIPIGSGLTTPQFPSVSPNGAKIAFEMNGHIWSIGADGTDLKQVTSGPDNETLSAWSPDGSQLAVISVGSGSALAIVSANPSTPTTISVSAPVWVVDKNNGVVAAQGSVDWKK